MHLTYQLHTYQACAHHTYVIFPYLFLDHWFQLVTYQLLSNFDKLLMKYGRNGVM